MKSLLFLKCGKSSAFLSAKSFSAPLQAIASTGKSRALNVKLVTLSSYTSSILFGVGKKSMNKFITRQCSIIPVGHAIFVINLYRVGGFPGFVNNKRYRGIGMCFQPAGRRVIGQKGDRQRLSKRIGRTYRIPKLSVIEFLLTGQSTFPAGNPPLDVVCCGCSNGQHAC